MGQLVEGVKPVNTRLYMLRRGTRDHRVRETVQLSHHRRSGRLQDIEMGEIVKVWKGGLRERVHVNDLKVFVRRDSQQLAARNAESAASAVEIAKMEKVCDWEPGKRELWL